MVDHSIKRMTGYAPIVMSVIAFALVLEAVAAFGGNRPGDEGWQAHIFHILMALQLPIIAWFVIAGRRSLSRTLPVVAAQLFFWVLAWTPVAYFEL
jgi:hypothetical protein